MADEKKSVEQAAGAIHDALEKRLLGQPEGAMAKVVVMAAAVASGSPWFLAAEPVLQRLLEIINNKAGKDAVAEIAGEVNAEEGFRKIALEVHQYVMPTIIDLFAQQHARGAIGLGQVVELTQSSIEDGIARVGIMLRRMEDRQASSTGLSDPHKPLRATVVLTGPTVAMHAVGREDQRDFAVVRAVT
ncbi:MAG: hypothetical protein ACLQVI_18505, partial [Polyangiaceae bacterium]